MKTTWSYKKAIKNLHVREIPFDPTMRGVARAYTTPGNEIAIDRGDRKHPEFVVIHELAHIVLGHTKDSSDRAYLAYHLDPRKLESEAHAVALIAAFALGFEDGVDYDEERELAYLSHFSEGIDLPPVDKVREAAATIVAAGLKGGSPGTVTSR